MKCLFVFLVLNLVSTTASAQFFANDTQWGEAVGKKNSGGTKEPTDTRPPVTRAPVTRPPVIKDPVLTGPAVTPKVAVKYWAVFALDQSNLGGDKAYISLGFARRETLAEAEIEAIKSCRVQAKSPQDCKVAMRYDTGCFYIATGSRPWGGVGWGGAQTPQGAYNECHNREFDCAVPVYGGCAYAENDTSRTNIVEAAKLPYWIALSVGRGSDSTTKYIAVSSAAGKTKAHASERGVASCNRTYPGTVTCETITHFNTGCGWVANAKTSPGDTLNWAISKTKQAAYDRCQSDGSTCDTKVTGHCFP